MEELEEAHVEAKKLIRTTRNVMLKTIILMGAMSLLSLAAGVSVVLVLLKLFGVI